MKAIAGFLFLLISLASYAADAPARPGFEKQILDVTYGEIWRPAGWHYAWRTTKEGIIWTVSKEESSKGYETGMRIQFIPAVKGSGKTAEQFAKDFIAQKMASVKVEKVCDEKEKGLFRVICLETTEPSKTPGKNYRVLYSVSWSNQRDWFVISIFGAPERDWEALKPSVDVMSEVVLIGKKFYEK